jgi:hypothetical protein
MSNRRRQRIPGWAKRERLSDIAWIGENVHVFQPAAQQQYQALGRGAIVVDTTVQPSADAGHPFTYYSQEQVNKTDDEDAQRMVREYDPEVDMVIVLLKPQDRVSVYRIRVT